MALADLLDHFEREAVAPVVTCVTRPGLTGLHAKPAPMLARTPVTRVTPPAQAPEGDDIAGKNAGCYEVNAIVAQADAPGRAGRACRAFAHRAGYGSCTKPVAAGLASTFMIFWPPAGHATTCQAFQQNQCLS